MTIQPGDVISIKDWSGTPISLRVKRVYDSKSEGPAVHGIEVSEQRFQDLPISHLIQTAKLYKSGNGKWDLAFPDGSIVRYSSRKSAEIAAEERDFVVKEVEEAPEGNLISEEVIVSKGEEETLVCQNCGTKFRRVKVRGRKPRFCEDHR